MTSAIVATSAFESSWPLAAAHAEKRWLVDGPVTVVRLGGDDPGRTVGELDLPADVGRLLLLGKTLTPACLDVFTALREVGLSEAS